MRELILNCAALPWNYCNDSANGRLSQVLIDQLQTLNDTPVYLPIPADSRAVQLVNILHNDHQTGNLLYHWHNVLGQVHALLNAFLCLKRI